MASRREYGIQVTGPANTSVSFGPFDARQTGIFTFTLQYMITAGVTTDATLTIRSSNLGRTAGLSAAPNVPIISLVTPNPQPGFSVIEATGVITCNASAIGTYEQTWSIPARGRLIWMDWQYNSGGGQVTPAINIGAWSA